MNSVRAYRDCLRDALVEARQIAEKRSVTTDTAIDILSDCWEMEKRYEEQLAATREEADKEKAALREAIPAIWQQAAEKGIVPTVRELLQQMGFPPTPRNQGVARWEIKKLSYQPNPAGMPAE
jgi:hypothetical protein